VLQLLLSVGADSFSRVADDAKCIAGAGEASCCTKAGACLDPVVPRLFAHRLDDGSIVCRGVLLCRLSIPVHGNVHHRDKC